MRGCASLGLGVLQGARGASGRQWETGGAPTDASCEQGLSVTGRSGIFTISGPALACARSRCLFRCRCVAATALGGRSASPILAPVLRRVPVRRPRKPPPQPGRETPAWRTSRHDMVRFTNAENRLGFRLQPPVQQAASYHAATRSRVPCRRLVHLPVRHACPFETAKWRLSAGANLRHKGVGHRRPERRHDRDCLCDRPSISA